MQRSVRIIEAYFDLPKRIEQLRRCAVASELDATVTLTTAHKAKGLEWNFVGFTKISVQIRWHRRSIGPAATMS